MKPIGRESWRQWVISCSDFGTTRCTKISLEFSRRSLTCSIDPDPLTPTLSPAGRGRSAAAAMRRSNKRLEQALDVLDRSEPPHPDPLPCGEREKRGCGDAQGPRYAVNKLGANIGRARSIRTPSPRPSPLWGEGEARLRRCADLIEAWSEGWTCSIVPDPLTPALSPAGRGRSAAAAMR